MQSPTDLAASFRARGLKVTPQRLQIFEVLHGSDEHLTADAVHERVRAEMPTVSLRTVYQTLNDLAAMGELVQLDLGTGSTRFDPTVEPHHHLVCEACGRVQDVPADRAVVRVPAGHEHGFEVVSTDVVFRGRCVSCRTGDPPVLQQAEPHPPTRR